MLKRCLICSLVILALAGCEDHGDLKEWMVQSSKGLKGQVEPLPTVKPYKPFIYSAFDLPSPFNPEKMKLVKGKNSPPQDRPKEELEKFDLEQLKMVGIIQEGKNIQALVKAPDGSLHRVRTGNYIGQNFGKVVGITEAEVKLTETVEDSMGDWIEREASLHLQEGEGKGDNTN